VLPHRPELVALKALLLEGGGAPVLMSGSGASVFAVVSEGGAAETLAARVRASGAFAVGVVTLPTNPMWAAVA
jgi:4-diphosphocytidyl-2C-methyl-D-erythritol kinase